MGSFASTLSGLEAYVELDRPEAELRTLRDRNPDAGRDAVVLDERAVVAGLVTNPELRRFEFQRGVHAAHARLVQRHRALRGIATHANLGARSDREAPHRTGDARTAVRSVRV